jgi:hypothetical protein
MRWFTAFALVGTLTAAESVAGQAPDPESSSSLVQTANQRLAGSLDRIARGSHLWRREIDSLRGGARRVVVLTPDQVVVVDRSTPDNPRAFDQAVLAEVSPVVEEGSAVSTVLVVVNLDLLDAIHGRRNSLPAERDADLDRILVHEVYGHALPYLQAGNVTGRCADPGPDERPADACSIARENAVRAELGLGRRVDYGLNGLLLGSEPERGFGSRGPALSLRR